MCNKCVIPLALFTFDTVDRKGAEGGELRILNVDLGEALSVTAVFDGVPLYIFTVTGGLLLTQLHRPANLLAALPGF